MSDALPISSVIGIMGGGQLGRMMAIAAAELGYKTHIYCPEEDSPAFEVAAFHTIAAYDDVEALSRFARSVQVISFEFENIPSRCLTLLQELVAIHPAPHILELSQNRLREKNFARELGIPTTAFARVGNLQELQQAVADLGCPAVLKTTELGYDGKGQVKLSADTDLASAWASLNTHEAILEAFVDYEREISVIVARGQDGHIEHFPPVENQHRNHILDVTIAPAPISPALADRAVSIARQMADALSLVGLLTVEMFITRDHTILMNEIAPRPHNSGHWTIDACTTSQFEQAIRAAAGLPLGSSRVLCAAYMKNLIGDDVLTAQDYLKDPNAKLHLYGKKEARAGRKMGHVTFLKK